MSKRVNQINEFMTQIGRRGGMSLTTGFDVEFQFRDTQNLPFAKRFYEDDEHSVVNMLCDEAQLPNVQSAVGSVTGRYLGEGQINYPHTRIFTDLGLGFLCDADLTPLKFLSSWYEHIFGESTKITQIPNTKESMLAIAPRKTNRVNRLKYMDEYVCDLKIMKTEPDGKGSNGRVPITYIMENCYPYTIDSVPLNYGTSQLTRVNASFYYTRHSIVYGQPYTPSGLDPDDPNFGNGGLTQELVGETLVGRGG